MKRPALLVFLFTCFLLPYRVFAQAHKTVAPLSLIDSLKNVLKTQNNDTNNVNIYNNLSNGYRILGSYDSALLYAENAQALAGKIKFKRGLADGLRNIGIIYSCRSYNQKALEFAFKSLIIYQDIGNKQGIESAFTVIGVAYNALGNYSKSLEYDFKVLSIAQEIKDTIRIASIFCNIGVIYGEEGNYSKSLEYFYKALKIQIGEGAKDAIVIDLGNIGYNYLMQGDYSKALEYDFKAVTQAQEVGDKDITANFLGDIGNVYYKQGDYIRALEYEFRATSIASEIGDIDKVADLYSNIGEIYNKLKNYKRAKSFLDSALILSKNTGNKKNIKIAYRNLAILDSLTANYKTAYSDYQKYIAYRDSIINQGTTQIEISYEFEKREDSIKAEYKQENIIKTAEIKRKKILNNGAIVILVLTILLAISLINKQKVKRKKEKIIFEKEKQHIENELSNAKKALEDYTRSMLEKNELLEQFKTDMDKLKNLKTKELEEVRIEQLEHLNKTTILTEDDWDKFKELFEQVYNGFFIRLKEKFPGLSQAEVRLVCLTKLKLDDKQMANILGVSNDAIRMTRHRMRKKLGLSENTSVDNIAESI